MAKKKLVKIEVLKGEEGQVFVLNQDIKGFNVYQKAKAINTFISSETKALETAIDVYVRGVLRENGIKIADGSNVALERAFLELENKGKSINLVDRYYEINNENIVGEINNMTVILEDDVLSCAVEVIINER